MVGTAPRGGVLSTSTHNARPQHEAPAPPYKKARADGLTPQWEHLGATHRADVLSAASVPVTPMLGAPAAGALAGQGTPVPVHPLVHVMPHLPLAPPQMVFCHPGVFASFDARSFCGVPALPYGPGHPGSLGIMQYATPLIPAAAPFVPPPTIRAV